MPVMDGIEATRRSPPRRTQVSARPDPHDLRSRRVCLRRPCAPAQRLRAQERPPEELLEAIRAIAAGEALLAPNVTRRLIDLRRHEASHRPSDRRPRSRPPSANARCCCWWPRAIQPGDRREPYVSLTTVKTHVSRILSKLGARDRAQLVMIAYESGLVQAGSLPRTGLRDRCARHPSCPPADSPPMAPPSTRLFTESHHLPAHQLS